MYFWNLGSSTPGLSPAEALSRDSSRDLAAIFEAPVNAPHRLLQLGLTQINSGTISLRSASVVFMLIFLVLFYLMIRLWFGRFIAALSTLILAASPWLVVVARSATPAVMLLAPLALIAEFLWLTRRRKYLNLSWLIFVITVALAIYIPGMIWFVLIGGAIKWKELSGLASAVNGWVASLSMLIFLAAITPLAMAIGKQPDIVKDLFLVPDQLAGTLATVKSIGWSALSLIWRLPYTTDLTVGRLPLLTLAQIAMSAFGLYAMWTNAKRETLQLAALLVASILLAGLNNQLLLLIPAVVVICIFTAAGLRYLYVEWRDIFPRNPLPRGLAVVLMLILVGVQLAYGWRYALVAWPNTAATKNVYMVEY